MRLLFEFINFCQLRNHLSSNNCRFMTGLNDPRTELRSGLKRSFYCSGGGGTRRQYLQSHPEVFLEIHNDMG